MKLYLTVLYLVCAAGVMSAVAKGEIVFSENFDNSAWQHETRLGAELGNGWSGNDNGTDVLAVVQRAKAANGTLGLFLADLSPSVSALASVDLGRSYTSGSVQFSFLRESGSPFGVRFIDAGHSRKNFELVIGNLKEGEGLYLRNVSNRVVGFVSFKELGYSLRDWSSIRVAFDEEAKTLAVYLDDRTVPVLELSGDTLSSIDCRIGKLEFTAGWSSGKGTKVYFDDITVRAK